MEAKSLLAVAALVLVVIARLAAEWDEAAAEDTADEGQHKA